MVVKSFTYQGFEEVFANAPHLSEVPMTPLPITELVDDRSKPAFSAEEMEIAKTVAKVDGIKEGYDQAKRDFEQEKLKLAETDGAKTKELLEKISFELSVLNFKAQSGNQQFMDKLSQLAVAITKKVCGNISDSLIEREISTILSESVSKLDTNEGVKIYLSQQNALNLNDKFTRGVVNVDEGMQLGDFRIEWQNGFAERDVKKLWKTIEEICGRHSSFDDNEKQETNLNNKEEKNG